jgi:predicted membrane protein
MKSIAIFSGSKTPADKPGKKVWSIAIFGASEIDFRQAKLEEGVTKVIAFSLCGANKIIVPQDMHATLSGLSIFGAKELKRTQVKEATPTSAKALHVTATSIFGACEVTDQSKDS